MRRVVSDFMRIENDVEQVVRCEAEIHVFDSMQAAGKQSGNDEQRQRSRHLRPNQNAADAVACRVARTASSGVA